MTEKHNPYQSPREYGKPGPKNFRELLERMNLQGHEKLCDDYERFLSGNEPANAHQEDFLYYLFTHFRGESPTQMPGLSIQQSSTAGSIWKCVQHPVDSLKRFMKGDTVSPPTVTYDFGSVDFDTLFNDFVREKGIQCTPRTSVPSALSKKGTALLISSADHPDSVEKMYVDHAILYGDALYLRRDEGTTYNCSGKLIGIRHIRPEELILSYQHSSSGRISQFHIMIMPEEYAKRPPEQT